MITAFDQQEAVWRAIFVRFPFRQFERDFVLHTVNLLQSNSLAVAKFTQLNLIYIISIWAQKASLCFRLWILDYQSYGGEFAKQSPASDGLETLERSSLKTMLLEIVSSGHGMDVERPFEVALCSASDSDGQSTVTVIVALAVHRSSKRCLTSYPISRACGQSSANLDGPQRALTVIHTRTEHHTQSNV